VQAGTALAACPVSKTIESPSELSGGNMPEVPNISTISKGVTDLARDAAYVAVGLGVLGFQRVQVQRVDLQNLLAQDEHLTGVRTEFTKGVKRVQGQRVELQNLLSKDQHLSGVRTELSKGYQQLDDLLDNASQFIESSLQPLEAQLPDPVNQLTTKAFEQVRELRSQIRQRVAAS
jgi:hypothetical protein